MSQVTIKSAKLQSRQGLALILTWKWLELDLKSWILKMIFENQLFKSSLSHFQVKIKASPCLDCNVADLIVTWLTWSQSSDFKSISSKIYVLLMSWLEVSLEAWTLNNGGLLPGNLEVPCRLPSCRRVYERKKSGRGDLGERVPGLGKAVDTLQHRLYMYSDRRTGEPERRRQSGVDANDRESRRISTPKPDPSRNTRNVPNEAPP